MKRLLIAAITVLVLALGGPTAVALADDDENDDGNDNGNDNGATVTTRTVTWTMTSAACQYLPANTTLNGTGTARSATTTKTARGVTTIRNTTNTRGTATDGNGHTYRFTYSNTFRIANTVASPRWFSGRMVDDFSLSGNGPARLHNGFVARLTTNPDFTYVTWHVRSSFGDPISFATGPVMAHCDPL